MKLATKIWMILVGVLALAVLGSSVTLFSVIRTGNLMQNMVTENLASVRAAEELEIALLEQRGFVASYMLDGGNLARLEELNRRKPAFEHWLARARQTAYSLEEQEILSRIAEVYEEYDTVRGEVIALYKRGNVEEARAILLRDIDAFYNRVYAMCEDFIAANERFIESAIANGRSRIRQSVLTVSLSVGLTVGLSLWLALLFFRGIFLPLRRMAEDARSFATGGSPSAAPDSSQDEMRAVGFYLRALMSDVAETRSSLEKSQSRLMNAEKLASVGKLAASVAHEIRNPLTSLKMRLFSIQEEMEGKYEEDLQVVSEEIDRLESIIHNFLEFSRPPELKLQRHPVSLLIDKTLELVGYRIQGENVDVIYEGRSDLPPVLADIEQIKQVFVNLLVNAAEAMKGGGQVWISTALELDREGRRMVVVRFRDSGSGIPEGIRDQIFEPFFSTKEIGTGLGLCIATQIMAQHGGRLELESSTAQGTTFAVCIPAAPEEGDEQDPRG